MNKFNRILAIVLAFVAAAAVIANAVIPKERHAYVSCIYTSNIQGNALYKSGENAGYEKIAGIRAELEDESALTILIDSGGCLGASAFAEENSGKDILSLMVSAGYSAMSLGTADYVYGSERLRQLSKDSGIPFLAANLESSGSTAFEDYIEYEQGGIRIIITGVCDSLPLDGMEGITVNDPSDTVNSLISRMSPSPDIVIVLANLSSKDEISEIASLSLVDAVIDGRSTSVSEEKEEGKALVVSAGSKGTNIGVITFEAGSAGVTAENRFINALEYDSTASEKKTAVLAEEYYNNYVSSTSSLQADVYVENIIGTSEDYDKDSNLPYETGTGDIIADAVLYACSKDGAEAALIPNTYIGGELVSGKISKSAVIALFPDDLHAVTFRVTGGELRDILEDCFSGNSSGIGYCQVAGLSFTYNSSGSIGTRLSNITINGETLDDARTYVIAGCTQNAASNAFSAYDAEQLSTYKSIAGITWQYIQQQFPEEIPETSEGSTESTEMESSEPVQEPVSPTRIIIY
ncbi:MAG: 5'-nucleotidase C-terminal domain-containing protein [Lachnospiraceae bacterium]|nr:5'-nucleotidase C-terminal domain-containing protein [Lachnospiraceae bacterium]